MDLKWRLYEFLLHMLFEPQAEAFDTSFFICCFFVFFIFSFKVLLVWTLEFHKLFVDVFINCLIIHNLFCSQWGFWIFETSFEFFATCYSGIGQWLWEVLEQVVVEFLLHTPWATTQLKKCIPLNLRLMVRLTNAFSTPWSWCQNCHNHSLLNTHTWSREYLIFIDPKFGFSVNCVN